MYIANKNDFDAVWKLFQENKKWFPHVWNTKIKKHNGMQLINTFTINNRHIDVIVHTIFLLKNLYI